jgi:hypothetical protein
LNERAQDAQPNREHDERGQAKFTETDDEKHNILLIGKVFIPSSFLPFRHTGESNASQYKQIIVFV